MKNLFKLFALALILFVSCDTGFNNKEKEEPEPQEPKLLSFKVKGFWDYENRYKSQTYTEAAEKLGTEDFVLKLGDFETLKRKDAIYISDYEDIKNYLSINVKENDIIVTLGAGNITKLATMLVEKK